MMCVGVQLMLLVRQTSSSASLATVFQHDFFVTARTSVTIGQMNATAVSRVVISFMCSFVFYTYCFLTHSFLVMLLVNKSRVLLMTCLAA